MENKNCKQNILRYLTLNERDEDWGIIVSTVGSQFIHPKCNYPPSNHPINYIFNPQNGRILNEYQLVYITKGKGYFSSQSCKYQKIEAGTMILLFPGEWHSYMPDKTTGWQEYWVGFKGTDIDKKVAHHFFTKEEPLHRVGISSSLINLYEDILYFAAREESGYQQIISGIVLHLLGVIYYKERNNSFTNTSILDKINEARAIMKENAEKPLPIQQIAEDIGVGYTWFRRMFKDYTGVSPAQYQMQQRLMRAKELLTSTDLNITEISYRLNFENGGQFATFFKKKEGITPSEFRERMDQTLIVECKGSLQKLINKNPTKSILNESDKKTHLM